jgi:hypothetical protein
VKSMIATGRAAGLAVPLGLLVACGDDAPGGGGRPEPWLASTDESGRATVSFQEGEVHYEQVCVATYQDACDRSCDECWDALDINNASMGVPACSRICDCSNRSDECSQWNRRFHLGPLDRGIDVACTRGQSRRRELPCGLEDCSCNSFAAAERSEAVSFYECIVDGAARGECHPDCPVSAGTFGTELCDSASARCGECVLDAQWLDDNTWFWRDDVQGAALRCVDLPSCGDVEGCLAAWYYAVTGYDSRAPASWGR